jgi:hypothetical protein
VLILVAVVVAGAAKLRPYQPEGDPRLPVEAVDTLGSPGLQGPLFHSFDWGGYLIWRLWPETRVFVDGRQNDLFDGMDREFAQYLRATNLHAGGDDVLEAHAIRTVLYLKDTPFVRYLLASGNWDKTYDDGRVIRLERRSPANRGIGG